MVPSGVAEIVELIWHFTGHLRLDPDGVARVSPNYYGAYGQNPQDDPSPDVTLSPFKPTPNDLDSDGSQTPTLVGPDEYKWVIHISQRAHDGLPNPHELKPTHLPFKPPILPPAGDGDAGGGGGGGFGEVHPVINQEIVDLRQFNVMENNDNASIGPTALPLQPFDSAPVLATMEVDAQKAVPLDLLPAEGNSMSVLEFVNARDADPTDTQTEEAPYTVSDGKYVNNVLQDPTTDVHQLTNDKITAAGNALDTGMVQAIPAGDYSDTAIQNLSLGGNVTINDATLISDSGLSGSMLILGNSYQTEAIFQTNVLSQSDHFQVSSGDAGINYIPNIVQNIADISTTGAMTGPWTAAGPLNWTVQVLDGSLYDVKAMSQTNYISDNDIVSQTQSLGYSLILAGSNEQVNSVDFQSPTGQWDMIVVEGSYHRLDMINQTNVVLDMNHASQDWAGSGDGSGSQSITAGNNTVLNDASIIYFGATGSLGVTGEMAELAQVLATNQAPDPSLIAKAFPELMGTVHVLYVTGDYYDVNYLAQTNVISNADVAAQLLTSSGTGQQSLTTGGNTSINAATIVDAGSVTTPYVQGTAYSDTILIQTNIIATDSKVVTNDPSKLAPEVIAFTGTDATDHSTDAPQVYAPPPQDVTHNSSDVLSGTLH